MLERIKAATGNRALSPDVITPTVGLNLAETRVFNVSAYFWDLGGQESLRSLWTKYYEEAHGILFVIDLADESRFSEAIECLRSVMLSPEFQEDSSDPDAEPRAMIPIVVWLNKEDSLTEEAGAEGRQRIFEAIESLPCPDSQLARVSVIFSGTLLPKDFAIASARTVCERLVSEARNPSTGAIQLIRLTGAKGRASS